jgi:hypothetical protein
MLPLDSPTLTSRARIGRTRVAIDEPIAQYPGAFAQCFLRRLGWDFDLK